MSSRLVLAMPHLAMHRRAASMTRCSCVATRSVPVNVTMRQIYPICLAVNRVSVCHLSLCSSRTTQDPGQELGPYQAADLAGVGEVPAALVADEAEQHAGHVIGGLLGIDARRQVLALQVGHEEAADEDQDALALNGELGQQALRLGLEHL